MDNSNCGNGCVKLIIGCMFSGKTTELLKQYKKYIKLNKKCKIIKYLNDTRYSKTGIATHDLLIQEKDVICCGKKLKDIEEKLIENTDVILIDEGQFYEDIVDFADNLANKGKIIIVVALDGTFERKPFGKIHELIPKSESVKKIYSICGICHKQKAHFSKLRSSVNNIANNNSTNNNSANNNIIIGGDEKYVATCRKCYNLSN
jgi:thymidine kinase